jgi:alpha-tubulin suppressor-like RCC1 family protein
MSQEIWTSINADNTSGTMLAAILTDFKDSLMSGMSGTTRPAQLQAGGTWIDTTLQGAPDYYWVYKVWDGVQSTEIFRIQVTNGFGGGLLSDSEFSITQVSADTVGPILYEIKNRIVGNGELFSGDTVAEIQFVGRTSTSTDPTVAFISWSATDDQTASAFGGTFSLYSTPDASSTITEHLKFISGLVEVPVPLLINSLQLVSQNVATAATINQLSAANVLVEFTGSTATALNGVNSGHNSKEVVLHNRSTASITLKNNSGSASAADRLSLPYASDFVVVPEDSVSLYYCTTDTKWKLKEGTYRKPAVSTETITGMWSKWTAPAGITSIVLSVEKSLKRITQAHGKFLDPYGNMYACGQNIYGGLGVGNTTPRSSPVLVLGGLSFLKGATLKAGNISNTRAGALDTSGLAYMWGENKAAAPLGTGSFVSRSSPTAVLGGVKFTHLEFSASMIAGIAQDGSAYAWGSCPKGGLGNGTVTNMSSPVAVIGGLKFVDIQICGVDSYINFQQSVYGITTDGAAYAWGDNSEGQLGHDDLVSRSSPVAIAALSGLKFKKFLATPGRSTGAYVFALTEDGVVYSWGKNDDLQLGLGPSPTDTSSPAILSVGGLAIKNIWTCSLATTIAQTTSGLYYSWGFNSGGEAATGNAAAVSEPVITTTLGGLSFDKIVPGEKHFFGILSDGTAYAWGFDNLGELGIGANGFSYSPNLVSGGLKFSSIVSQTDYDNTAQFSRAVTNQGLIYAWGYNADGGLGIGNVTSVSIPTILVGAFGGTDGSASSREINVTVVPGTVYSLKLGPGQCYFQNEQLGYDIETIKISYIA